MQLSIGHWSIAILSKQLDMCRALEYRDTLQAAGYVQGKANPCLFYHAEFNVSVIVHGDDFVALGPGQHLGNIKATLSDKYKIKIWAARAFLQSPLGIARMRRSGSSIRSCA